MDRDTIATLTAKTRAVPIPIGPSGFGLAIAGDVIYDPGHQTRNGFLASPIQRPTLAGGAVNIVANGSWAVLLRYPAGTIRMR
jgi:hypothetical protein